jgi:hypothetical protein
LSVLGGPGAIVAVDHANAGENMPTQQNGFLDDELDEMITGISVSTLSRLESGKRLWNCSCHWPGRTASRSTGSSRPRPPATRVSTSRRNVLAGEVRVILGERELLLRPGEVAEFDTSEPHWFGPAGDGVAEILHLFGPQGDKANVRTRT